MCFFLEKMTRNFFIGDQDSFLNYFWMVMNAGKRSQLMLVTYAFLYLVHFHKGFAILL